MQALQLNKNMAASSRCGGCHELISVFCLVKDDVFNKCESHARLVLKWVIFFITAPKIKHVEPIDKGADLVHICNKICLQRRSSDATSYGPT
jgi:hypothetical protein